VLQVVSRDSRRNDCRGAGVVVVGQQNYNKIFLKEMADDMSIDKKEPNREGSEDSMELNSPTPEAETGAPQENAAQQKRKGGRKPVGSCSSMPRLNLS
jgi:hypothetical protein